MSTPRPDRAPRSRRPGLLLWRQALGPHLRALALVASGAVLLASLPAVGRAAAAMELLGGLNQWRQGNRGPETDSLIDIGTTGLRAYA